MGEDGSGHDARGRKRWAARRYRVRARNATPTEAPPPNPRAGDLTRHYLPLGMRNAMEPVTSQEREFFDHHGTTADRAFGRLVHEVLHRALLERQTDTLSQLLLKRLKRRPGSLRDDLERQLIERELRRTARILDAVFAIEAHNFGTDVQSFRDRASEYLGRYVTSDDYLFAKLWHYSLPDTISNPAPVPMLEFAFRVGTEHGINLVGRFDRVDDRKGHPVVIDYKTGPPRSLIALGQDHQMLLYAAAIADLTAAPSVTCEIHWLATGTKSTLTFAGAELRRVREEAARYTQQVERANILSLPRPPAHTPDPTQRMRPPPARPDQIA